MRRLHALLAGHSPALAGFKLSLDANSAWSPETAAAYLDAVRPIADSGALYMLEQPFPVDLLHGGGAEREAERARWIEAKEAWQRAGVLVYADESVCTAAEVLLLRPYVHGVNIKLEKAGGIRGALLAIEAARREGLLVWIGSMVGSLLSSSIPAHIYPLVDFGGDLGMCPLTVAVFLSLPPLLSIPSRCRSLLRPQRCYLAVATVCC